jgi:Kdo2-lipid IVA lauroyltransferase/acyltransferase
MSGETTSKRIGRAVGRGALLSMQALVRRLSLPAALALGRKLGDLMRRLSKKRYGVALKNLKIAYGETLTEADRERIATESFRSFGMFAMESIKFGYLSEEEVERRVKVVPKAYAEFQEVMAMGKGCLLVGAHLGNFEVAGRWLKPRGYELIGLVRESRDRGTTDIMTRARERLGIKVITLRQSLKPVLVGLKRNALVAIICDQNAADVFVPFFGHLTGTADGPAKLALRTGAPLLFFYCVRDGKGGYIADTEGYLVAESTGDEKADVERIMAEVNARLERMIRRYPEQWLWFHDRWKSSPAVTPQSE